MGDGRIPIHDPGRCEECDRRRRNLDTARILDIAIEAGETITSGRDGVTMVGRHRLDDLVLVRGRAHDGSGDTVALRTRPDAPEHGTRFMGGRL